MLADWQKLNKILTFDCHFRDSHQWNMSWQRNGSQMSKIFFDFNQHLPTFCIAASFYHKIFNHSYHLHISWYKANTNFFTAYLRLFFYIFNFSHIGKSIRSWIHRFKITALWSVDLILYKSDLAQGRYCISQLLILWMATINTIYHNHQCCRSQY